VALPIFFATVTSIVSPGRFSDVIGAMPERRMTQPE
jgi:hypothetical protein